MKPNIPIVLALIALSLPAQPCQGSGIVLSASGGRLGDGWSYVLAGAPGDAGWLGVDVGAGPVTTPIGTACLDFSPGLQLWPFTFDALGMASWSDTLPAMASASGIELTAQAAAASPAGVVTISNAVTKRVRSPAILAESNGPTGIVCLDGFTGGQRWRQVAQAGTVVSTAWLGQLDRFAAAANVGEVGLYDPLTGILTGGWVLAKPEIGANLLAAVAAEDGRDLILVWAPVVGPGNTYVQRLDTTTGGIVSTAALGMWSPPLNPKIVQQDPASPTLWLRSGPEVRAIDTVGGTVSLSLTFGNSFIAWVFGYGRLYLLNDPGGIEVIDRSTGAAIPGSPFPLPALANNQRMALGPGSAGTGLMILASGNLFTGSGGGFAEFDPVTVTQRQSTTTTWSPLAMAPDPAGGGWIVLEAVPGPLSTNAQAVRWLDPTNLASTVISTLPTTTFSSIAPMPSDTLAKTWLKTAIATVRVLDTSATPVVGPSMTITGVDLYTYSADR